MKKAGFSGLFFCPLDSNFQGSKLRFLYTGQKESRKRPKEFAAVWP